MLEIIRGLKSVQQQIDVLMEQLKSLVPDSGDHIAETCRSLAQTPFCVAEPVRVKPYESLLSGIWLGFAKTEQVEICQHVHADTASENHSYALTISTGPNFRSGWLTIEFLLTRAEIITRQSLSINAALSSNVSGNLQFAVKSHGREIEPKFSELAKYEIIQGTLRIADLASLAKSVEGITEEYDDVRVLMLLPPAANATFTFSRLLLALL